MNYQKIHDQIIERAKVRNLTDRKKIYFETHHIIPRCLGGSEDASNKVNLLAREHFLIHWLLHRIYPDSEKLSYAFYRCTQFNHAKEKFVISSRTYEEARIAFSVSHSNTMKYKYKSGYINPLKNTKIVNSKLLGVKHSVERSKQKSIYQTGLKHKKHKRMPRACCLFCKGEFSIQILSQFHGDLCKSNLDRTVEIVRLKYNNLLNKKLKAA